MKIGVDAVYKMGWILHKMITAEGRDKCSRDGTQSQLAFCVYFFRAHCFACFMTEPSMVQAFLFVIISDGIVWLIAVIRIYFYQHCIVFQISLRPARDSMAASQLRPGITGRSQMPPAQKPLVRKFFKTLFLSFKTNSCLCTGFVEDVFIDKCIHWYLLLLYSLVFIYALFHW